MYHVFKEVFCLKVLLRFNFRNLCHENILLLMNFIKPNWNLVFEYPTYGFLHRILFLLNKQFNSSDILKIAKDISNALNYIHTQGYIHNSVTTFSVTLDANLLAKVRYFVKHYSTYKKNTSSSVLYIFRTECKTCGTITSRVKSCILNPLWVNPAKWLNTLKQFIGYCRRIVSVWLFCLVGT